MQYRPLQWYDIIEYVSTQNFMRCSFKLCINNYQIYSWTVYAVLMTFEANKSIHIISKSGVLFYMLKSSMSSILK